MSSVKIKFSDGKFSLIQEDLESHYADIFTILRCQKDQTVPLKGIKFGFHVQNGKDILIKRSYPDPSVEYESSDQDYLTVDRVYWEPEFNVDVLVWMHEHKSERIEEVFTLKIPRPPQPFASWAWVTPKKIWDAPKPMPSDSKEYSWNEDKLDWVRDV